MMTACDRAPVDLKGHWHVWEYFDPAENHELHSPVDSVGMLSIQRDSCKNIFVDYETLDILNDSTPVWNKDLLGYEGIGGWLNKQESTISIGGECLFLGFNYEFRNDTLFLKEEKGKNYIAIKGGCCDKQREFFGQELRLDIDLPVLTSSVGLVPLEKIKKHLCPDAYLGHIQSGYNLDCFGPRIRLALSQAFATRYDIRNWLENNSQSVDPSKRDSLIPIIYSNRVTDFEQFFMLLDSIQVTGQKEVYLAFREKNFEYSLNVWLKRINFEKDNYKSFIRHNYVDDEFELEKVSQSGNND